MLSRLLVLAAVAYAVWQLWHRLIGTGGRPRDRSAGRIEDMAQCPVCGTYVAAGSGRCGRQDCPRRR